MVKPKTSILEREHYTKYFLAVAFHKVKTSNDLCKFLNEVKDKKAKKHTKTLRKTSENYSNFLKALEQKSFLQVKRSFGKYYVYSVNWEGVFSYVWEVIMNKKGNPISIKSHNLMKEFVIMSLCEYFLNLKKTDISLQNLLKGFVIEFGSLHPLEDTLSSSNIETGYLAVFWSECYFYLQEELRKDYSNYGLVKHILKA